MATYCMADLHGQLGAFHQMLDMIGFAPEDRLYMIGDVVDRGPCGIELLQEIMHMPNVTMLLGNHELMMLDYLGPNPTERQILRWNKNRNRDTLKKFQALDTQQQEQILTFLRGLPDCLDFYLNGKRFFLVHGFPAGTTFDAVWDRPSGPDAPNPLPGRQVIVGHTPTALLLYPSDAEQDRYFQKLEQTGGHMEIFHGDGFVDLDCGCGHSAPGCALACLRLEDFQEFYVPIRTFY